MRKHRRYERVDRQTVLTVQTPCMTPRLIMDMVSADVEPQVQARKAFYGAGSETNRLPRTMSIDRFSRMATPRPVEAPPTDPPVEPSPQPQEV